MANIEEKVSTLQTDVGIMKEQIGTLKEGFAEIKASDKRQEGLLAEMSTNLAILRESSEARMRFMKWSVSIIGTIGVIVGIVTSL